METRRTVLVPSSLVLGSVASAKVMSRLCRRLHALFTRLMLVGLCGVAPIDEQEWPTRLKELPPTAQQWERTTKNASKVRLTVDDVPVLVYQPEWSLDYLRGKRSQPRSCLTCPDTLPEPMEVSWSDIDLIERRTSTPLPGMAIGAMGGVGLTLLLSRNCEGPGCVGIWGAALILGSAGAAIGGVVTGWPRWSTIYDAHPAEDR